MVASVTGRPSEKEEAISWGEHSPHTESLVCARAAIVTRQNAFYGFRQFFARATFHAISGVNDHVFHAFFARLRDLQSAPSSESSLDSFIYCPAQSRFLEIVLSGCTEPRP